MSVNNSKEIQNVVLNVQETVTNRLTMENQMESVKSILTCLTATEPARQSARRHSRMKEQKAPVLSTKMCLAVTTLPVPRPARTLLTASNAPGSARDTRGTRSVAMDAPESAPVLSSKREPWKNAGSTAWSLMSVSTRSVLVSAWTRQRAESVHRTVRNTQETPGAASVVTALLSARRNHCGESVLLSARSLQATLTAVPQHVLLNVRTEGARSAALVVLQSVMASLAAALRSLTWCLELECTWRTMTSAIVV